MKHVIFQGPACGRTDYNCQNATGPYTYNFTHQQWCQQYSLDVQVDGKLVSDKWCGATAILQLVTAGLVEADPGFRMSIATGMSEKNSFHPFNIYGGSWRNSFNAASFDRNVYFRIIAFHSTTPIANYLTSYSAREVLGGEYFTKRLMDKNFLLANGIIFEGRPGSAYASSSNKFISALNSKLASELDAKIDDGRPTTGNLMGIKPSKGKEETDAEKSKRYCYDMSGNDIEKALYNTSTNTQYGCDLVYVLKPVK